MHYGIRYAEVLSLTQCLQSEHVNKVKHHLPTMSDDFEVGEENESFSPCPTFLNWNTQMNN